jgi:hypothetical protein
MYINFIDHKKAFDCVDMETFLEASCTMRSTQQDHPLESEYIFWNKQQNGSRETAIKELHG